MEGNFSDQRFTSNLENGTPSGSPPNINAAQQRDANSVSAYPGAYSYQHGAGPSTSAFTNVPQAMSQHSYGQLSGHIGSNYIISNAIPPYSHGSGPIRRSANHDIDPNLGGRPFGNAPAQQKFNHGGDDHTNQTRQEPSGTRTTSAAKRVKRDSAEHVGEAVPRVGDRNLQTVQARYGVYSGTFSDPDQARHRLTTRQWTPPQDPNRTTPSTAQEMLPYVIQVYDAITDTQSGFYDKLNAANRLLNGKYAPEMVEATAWLIVVSWSAWYCKLNEC